jgi:hypothetical protein
MSDPEERKQSPENLDMTLVPIGVRIPTYLDDFLKRYEDRELNISKSTIIRNLLEYGYQHPEIISLEKTSSNQVILDQEKVSELFQRLEKIEKRQDEFLQLLDTLNSRVQLNRTVLEKVLGKSLENLEKAPDYIIEQLYADFKDAQRD